MDGAGLGRPNAPHSEAPSAFGTPERTQSISVWPGVEHRGRAVFGDYRESVVGTPGSLDAAVISSHLHPIEEEDSSMHAARSISWGYGDSDRMGGSFRRHRSPCLVSFFDSLPVAVSPFPGDCLDVP